jgi:hypothetical protein
MRERRKSKDKISGRRATVKGKQSYDVTNFREYYLQRTTMTGNVPETVTATNVAITDPDETKLGNYEQLDGEDISHDQKIEDSSN